MILNIALEKMFLVYLSNCSWGKERRRSIGGRRTVGEGVALGKRNRKDVKRPLCILSNHGRHFTMVMEYL